MAMLTTQHRNALMPKTFGLPGKRAYPMPDAKARATQEVKAGNLTAGQKAEIDAKANKVLAK